ncbi:MAG TPA: family 10 glycosylhydrolase [Thermoguttaceae bacterium]|nr:family 10 glycosylhydrolase [Thermoguttaceae bacterium]
MRKTATLGVALVVGMAVVAGAQDTAVLKVKGRGVEGRPAYDGGGVVKFLDARLAAQIVHRQADAEEGAPKIALPLEIRYDVLEPAPILLTSRMGTEYWRLYGFEAETMSAMYVDEKIDLAKPGERTATATRAWFGPRYGPLPTRGLVGIRGHYYFLIDRADGKWIDVTEPPSFFDQREAARKLTFTLADLSEFSLSIAEIQSTWEPGGPFRVRVTVKDAQGEVLPVINVPLTAAAGDWLAPLATEWGPLSEPTGWIEGTLPDRVPEKITVQGTVSAQTPKGLEERRVVATFDRGDGRVSAQEFTIAEQGYQLPRSPDGAIRETRAVWVSTSDISTAEGIDTVVDRCTQARLNVLIPDVLVRNGFFAKSDLMPLSGQAEEGLDPLGRLIEKAHAAGLEVHPWFCVTYRDRHFREWFQKTRGADCAMIDKDGKPISLGADVHRPEYRDFIVDLMVGVARDYPVDGIHLDYIRTMGQCYCPKCRAEFAGQYGGPLSEASEEDWIKWQRLAIGDVVQRTAEGVRRVRPKARTSAAVFSSMQGGAIQGQDPAGWARQGWTDLILPMDYQMQTLQVRSNERQFLEALDEDDKLVTGLSLYMRSGSDVSSRPPELVREQIDLVRRLGIHGYCLFAFSHLSDEQLPMIREDVNTEPAVPYFR